MNILIFLDDFFEKKKLNKEFIKSVNSLIDHRTTLFVVSKHELPFPEVFFQKNGINSVKIKLTKFPEIHSTLNNNVQAFLDLNSIKDLSIVYSEELNFSKLYITQLNSKKWDAGFSKRKNSKKSSPTAFFIPEAFNAPKLIKKNTEPIPAYKPWAQLVQEQLERDKVKKTTVNEPETYWHPTTMSNTTTISLDESIKMYEEKLISYKKFISNMGIDPIDAGIDNVNHFSGTSLSTNTPLGNGIREQMENSVTNDDGINWRVATLKSTDITKTPVNPYANYSIGKPRTSYSSSPKIDRYGKIIGDKDIEL